MLSHAKAKASNKLHLNSIYMHTINLNLRKIHE
jgi:hypothetical protein